MPVHAVSDRAKSLRDECLSIRENTYKVLDRIKPCHVLVSVFDKSNLEELIKGLLELNSSVMFYSTGGTGKNITEILGERVEANYMSVESFTGAPEMEGGLVKTLHPKIHAGLLAERGNPAHEDYLENILPVRLNNETKGVYFDILAGNLYPFTEAVKRVDATAETARVNIDIGGPTMIMAAAKNWPSVAVLSSPSQYASFLTKIKSDGETISARQRFLLAQEAFKTIAQYRSSIAEYFGKLEFDNDVLPNFSLVQS